MRKEYNNRHDAPLINPGFTIEEYDKMREEDNKEKAENEQKNQYGRKYSHYYGRIVCQNGLIQKDIA